MSLKRFFDFRESRDEPKPFLDHLEDLRFTIFKMAAVLLGAMMLCFAFRSEVAAFVQRPLGAVDPSHPLILQSFGVADSFTVSLELAFYGGMVISFPFLLWFLAGFVLPALTPKEKRMLFPASFLGFGLFLAGASFAYFGVLPRALNFFLKDARTTMNWQPNWPVREYYSFTTQFVISFGLAFELPVVVLVLVKLGVVDCAFLARTRAFAFVIIMVLAAVLAPTPDVLTLFLMGAPMYLLYELCIGIAWFMGRKKAGE